MDHSLPKTVDICATDGMREERQWQQEVLDGTMKIEEPPVILPVIAQKKQRFEPQFTPMLPCDDEWSD